MWSSANIEQIKEKDTFLLQSSTKQISAHSLQLFETLYLFSYFGLHQSRPTPTITLVAVA